MIRGCLWTKNQNQDESWSINTGHKSHFFLELSVSFHPQRRWANGYIIGGLGPGGLDSWDPRAKGIVT